MDDIGGCGIMKSICIKATGFRRIIVALLAIMICIMPYAVSSADGTPAFVDDAGLCSEDEVQEINTRLDGLCGTAAVISPVGKIVDHGKEICFPSGMDDMGPVIKKLYDTLTGIQMGHIEAPEGWIKTICKHGEC